MNDRLAEAGIQCSVASRGHPFDSAFAETVSRPHEVEPVNRETPWRTGDSWCNLEDAASCWVHRRNTQRLHSACATYHLPRTRLSIARIHGPDLWYLDSTEPREAQSLHETEGASLFVRKRPRATTAAGFRLGQPTDGGATSAVP